MQRSAASALGTTFTGAGDDDPLLEPEPEPLDPVEAAPSAELTRVTLTSLRFAAALESVAKPTAGFGLNLKDV